MQGAHASERSSSPRHRAAALALAAAASASAPGVAWADDPAAAATTASEATSPIPLRRAGLGHGTHLLLPELLGVSASSGAVYPFAGLGGYGFGGTIATGGLVAVSTSRSAGASSELVAFQPRFDVAIGRVTVGGSAALSSTSSRAGEQRARSTLWSVAPRVGYLVPIAEESLFVWPTASVGLSRGTSRFALAAAQPEETSASTNLTVRVETKLVVPLGRWVTFGVGPALAWTKNLALRAGGLGGATYVAQTEGLSTTSVGFDAHLGLVF